MDSPNSATDESFYATKEDDTQYFITVLEAKRLLYQ